MSDVPRIPDFTMLRPIGRGAYGEVWLARSVTGVHRAVKIVRRDRFEDDRPFEREFAGIRRFEPVSVGQESQVALLHVGRNDEAGFFYYVMELADDVETGEEIFPDRYVPKTLKELRARRKRLPSDDCLGIGLALTRALAHLHENALVHRDIKPSNVIFVHGVPKLADIGLVSGMDTSHSFVGTEGFVPPEGPGTAAADVFSLGKVLYELSTGRDRTEFPQLPESLETLPDRRGLLELNEVVLKACDRDLRRRYRSAESMREDLLLLQAGRSIRRLQVMERRLRFVAKYGLVATVLSAVAMVSFLWASAQTRRANQNLERAERAEAEVLERLREANFNWARANRLTGIPGQRHGSLAELAKAAARTNRLDLRNEAIACLILPDVRPLKSWAKTPLWDSFNFSHDFGSYGTNDALGNIYIRDTESDRLRLTLNSQGAPLSGAVSSPDGRFVATSDQLGRTWLWSTNAAQPRPVPSPVDGRLLTFTPDGDALVVKRANGALTFINTTSLVEERSLEGYTRASMIYFNPAGTHFLHADQTRVFVHRRSGPLVNTIELPGGAQAIQWHPDGRRFAAAWTKHLAVWDVETGRQRSLFVGHETTVVGLSFDGSGEWLASASWDRTTRLWQADTGRELLRLNVSGNKLRLSPDGRRLAFKSWDNSQMHLFELADTSVARRYSISPTRFLGRSIFSPDGRWVVAVDGHGLYWFEPPAPAPVAFLPVSGTICAAFQPDGGALLTGGERGIRRWPLERIGDDEHWQLGPRHVVDPTFGRSIGNFHLADDGRWLVAAPGLAPYFAFDRQRPEHVVLAGVEVRPGSLLHVSRDATLSTSLSERHPNRLQLWNPRTGQLLTNIESATAVRQAVISPDNRWLALAALDNTSLWSLRDGIAKPVHRFNRAEAVEDRYPLAFNADSGMLAAVMSDREVVLINVESGTRLAALPVDRLISSIGFNPAGDVLAVTSERGWFQLWDLALLRDHLAGLNLDWPGPPLSRTPAPASRPPSQIQVLNIPAVTQR